MSPLTAVFESEKTLGRDDGQCLGVMKRVGDDEAKVGEGLVDDDLADQGVHLRRGEDVLSSALGVLRRDGWCDVFNLGAHLLGKVPVGEIELATIVADD